MDFIPGSLNYWVLQTIAMLATALLIPGLTVKGPIGALAMVIALAYVNAKVWDATLFFQIPHSVTTHTAILLLANGILFWILVKILPGIEVEGFLPALVAPIVFTILSILVSYYLKDIDWLLVLERSIQYIREFRDYLSSTVPAPDGAPVPPHP